MCSQTPIPYSGWDSSDSESEFDAQSLHGQTRPNMDMIAIGQRMTNGRYITQIILFIFKMENLQLLLVNVRGFDTDEKRKYCYTWLNELKIDIIFFFARNTFY